MNMLDAALQAAKNGFPVFPCREKDEGDYQTKSPYPKHGFKDATTDPEQIRRFWTRWPDAMIGVPMGAKTGLLAIDIDIDPDRGKNGFEAIKAGGTLSTGTLAANTPRGGKHLYYRFHEGISNSTSELADGVDVRSEGGYTIIPPSVCSDGRGYTWENPPGMFMPPLALDSWVIERLAKKKSNGAHSGGAAISGEREKNCAQTTLDRIVRDIGGLKTGARNQALNKGAFSLGTMISAGWISRAEVESALTSAALRCGLNAREIAKTLASGLSAGVAKPHKELQDRNSVRTFQPGDEKARHHTDVPDPREPEEFRPPEFTDESLALKFAQRNKDHLRYVAKWNQWLQWDGKRWAEDQTLHAYDLARRECRESASSCNKQKVAAAIASAKTVAAVERLARSDRRLAATVDQWDSDPWLLNTPGGVIDLRTGDLHRHRADDHITKITAVSPAEGCPLWRTFLERVTGNTELEQFLARTFGYAATGSTKEHALFFGHGTGSNGKSVMLNTVSNILGDYARSAPIETFVASHVERHPTELAGLRGARLVTAVETEEGRRWAEARIKALTGGDRISARFMRQDFFEFVPQFKLIIAGNHKPGLRSVDEAIRRRFNLIPFTVTIPAKDRDPDLSEKLKAEWPGILQWIIDGCRDWQTNGLRPPKIVTDATAAYLEAEDAVQAWLTDACFRESDAWAKSTELFGSWKGWAERAGEPAGTQKRFSQKLESRGFVASHTRTGNGFAGLRLIPHMTGDER